MPTLTWLMDIETKTYLCVVFVCVWERRAHVHASTVLPLILWSLVCVEGLLSAY